MSAGIKKAKEEGSIYVISVGINKYESTYGALFSNCVNDSRAIVEKIINDNPCVINPETKSNTDQRGRDCGNVFLIDSVYTFLLNDNNANLHAIKETFKTVAKSASSNDYFIFYFAGVTYDVSGLEAVLIPFIEESFHIDSIPSDQLLPLSELARLMEQIPCNDQLVISEAGYGKTFAQNLIAELFESNPLVAAGTERNRIILTTKSYGYDNCKCIYGTINHGPLTHFILNNQNPLNVFTDIDNYEYDLVKSEVECNLFDNSRKYFAVYQEKEFRKILINNYQKTLSRGASVLSVPEDTEKDGLGEVKIYSLIVATNEYLGQPNWRNLKNPINDAEEVSSVLKAKYNVDVLKLYNKPKDTVLMELLKIKNKMNENDKFIFFIAGHGYYSNDFSDGSIVFYDSKSLSDDFTLDSYLQMASLNRLLDNMPSRNVFAIFDICFGASFDLNSKDLTLSDYDAIKMDISFDEFDKRKSEYFSRIFLASGRYEVPDYWVNSSQHSPFADKLIKLLKEEDSFITPGKIYTKLEGNVTEPYLKQFGKHEVKGDFILKVD